MLSMHTSAPSMAPQFSALTSSQTSPSRNSRQTHLEPNCLTIMHPVEDSCKLHLQRHTQLRLQQTGEASTPPQSKTKEHADLAGTHAHVYQYDSKYSPISCRILLLSFFPSFLVSFSISFLHTSTYIISHRAFSAVAQIESDAILAGLTTTSTILSTQQMTKW